MFGEGGREREREGGGVRGGGALLATSYCVIGVRLYTCCAKIEVQFAVFMYILFIIHTVQSEFLISNPNI